MVERGPDDSKRGDVVVTVATQPNAIGSNLPPRRGRRASHAHLFLLPWIVGLVTITLGPLLAAVFLSFTDYDLLSSPHWVGLANYKEMFGQDPRYMKSVRVTAVYVFVSVPLQLVFALFLAVLLNKGIRGLAVYRATYYLPSLLGGSVAIAILWRQLFSLDGAVNAVLRFIGFADLPAWISDPATALGTLIVLHVWAFGSPMIIFLAGLRQIPTELYEQASVDGVGRAATFLYITLPMLSPIVFFNLVLQIISAFQAFTPAFVVSGGTGGPVNSTLFYTLYLYQKGFTQFQMGYASAMGCILLLVVGIATGLNFLASRFWVFYNE